ncbi:hypothetical protein B0T16DRAFT_463165 [Cercophora newfieldiana]|uniref:F-box domain-containing protein n=1 Tax=Cercophora newfieldiana TaxID=92897 RepID=A0AA39XSM6_9PEZI|nr:hypothetical protein B0T16DRAFT_463165 [Cercophora newfieldiana]
MSSDPGKMTALGENDGSKQEDYTSRIPTEILVKIFELVEGLEDSSDDHYQKTGYRFHRDDSNITDIKNCRLTSRRFCDASSHLLVRVVRVDIRPSAIARLEAIAKHPIISKGVRAVAISLGHYSPESAQRFDLFFHSQYHKLGRWINDTGYLPVSGYRED